MFRVVFLSGGSGRLVGLVEEEVDGGLLVFDLSFEGGDCFGDLLLDQGWEGLEAVDDGSLDISLRRVFWDSFCELAGVLEGWFGG